MTDQKPLKTRIRELENDTPQGGDHEYTKVIDWGENDEMTEKFYRDGVEITRAEWKKGASGTPTYKVSWGDDD